MRVLVTGGAGFIGSYIVDALLESGHIVVVVDDLRIGRKERVNPGAELARVDIRDFESLRGVFQDFQPEVVSHQAAQSEVPLSVKLPILDAQINIIGGLNILELCREYGAHKVIFASTAALYGNPDRVPCDETQPLRPLAPYGVTKASFELYLAQYHRTFGLDFTVLRYANVYGARQDAAATEGRVVAVFASQMLADVPVTVDGDGAQARDFIYAKDVAAANIAALNRGSGAVLHVGTGVATSISDLFVRMARLTGYTRAPLRGPRRSGDASIVALDSRQALEVLGWRATTDLDTGLAATIDELRAIHTLSAD